MRAERLRFPGPEGHTAEAGEYGWACSCGKSNSWSSASPAKGRSAVQSHLRAIGRLRRRKAWELRKGDVIADVEGGLRPPVAFLVGCEITNPFGEDPTAPWTIRGLDQRRQVVAATQDWDWNHDTVFLLEKRAP